ncbi:NYN domain-containing protein [Candidatus Kaiserbacteria bacterium]|nr:NYN domain-containing protein [Candidatus Kaiserbacteria bacterium]
MPETIIYIDAANIILSAQNLDFDLDIFKLIQHLKDSFRSAHIVYFTGNFKSKQEEFLALEQMEVEMVYKEIYNEHNKSKANCDVEISHRMTSDLLLGTAEKIVLLSGDGDFACLCDFAQSKDITIKVMAFDPVSCSRVIKRRQFAKVSYLVELGALITKEKPPAGT